MLIQLVTVFAAAALRPDTIPVDTARTPAAPVAVVVEAQQDTVRRPRRKAIEVGDWYHRRLVVHRTLSYLTIPVFAGQWIAGNQIFQEGSSAPEWARVGHRVGATTLAGIFTVNTVTGLWNLWDSRSATDHRVLRIGHSIAMLTADAAFTYAGVKLSEQAEQSQEKRKLHRTIALSAMGLTVSSGVIMKLFNK